MLVGERMSSPVITLVPEMPVAEALSLMKRSHIRRAPVLKNGLMIGIVSDKDLLNASPSAATSLSVWEMNYLLSKVAVKDVMSKKVLFVSEDTPIEEAARVMADNKIGGLPVMRGQAVVGMITETDLFKIFLEFMGAREPGVRVTAIISDRRGTLANLTRGIADAGGSFISFGQFTGHSENDRLITFKVSGLDEAKIREVVAPLVQDVIDIRTWN
jgi:acetoin utilization protein AcuB